jgi:hypothetical protein
LKSGYQSVLSTARAKAVRMSNLENSVYSQLAQFLVTAKPVMLSGAGGEVEASRVLTLQR